MQLERSERKEKIFFLSTCNYPQIITHLLPTSPAIYTSE